MSLLEFLKFESKIQRPVVNYIPNSKPSVIQASIIGAQIVIKDLIQGKWLYYNGNFGNFVGHRMDFVNNKCFPSNFIDLINESVIKNNHESKFDCNDLNISVLKDKSDDNLTNEKNMEESFGKTWLKTKRSNNYLFLSLIEALYLLELESIFQFNSYNKNDYIVKFQIKNFQNFKQFYYFICQNIIPKNELKVFIKRYVLNVMKLKKLNYKT